MSLSKEEKKKLKSQYLENEKIEYILTYDQAESLFDFLEEKLDESGCDHTLRFTKEWISKNKIKNTKDVLNELNEMGGYCDCEVILNCYEDYELA